MRILQQARIDEARRLLQGRLGYHFVERGLFERALSHRSAVSSNNERLEFLGDAVLSLIIAEALHQAGPDASEGQLTRWRASLVRKETLAELARELDVGAALLLGSGELKSGGPNRDSILADALEALFGALYLDAGFQVCSDLIRRLFACRLNTALLGTEPRDPKTRLQEYLQGRGLPLPTYVVDDVQGAAHEQHFTVICNVASVGASVSGKGASRRKAEQAAAQIALDSLAEGGNI